MTFNTAASAEDVAAFAVNFAETCPLLGRVVASHVIAKSYHVRHGHSTDAVNQLPAHAHLRRVSVSTSVLVPYVVPEPLWHRLPVSGAQSIHHRRRRRVVLCLLRRCVLILALSRMRLHMSSIFFESEMPTLRSR